jgi:hypothetical protein
VEIEPRLLNYVSLLFFFIISARFLTGFFYSLIDDPKIVEDVFFHGCVISLASSFLIKADFTDVKA